MAHQQQAVRWMNWFEKFSSLMALDEESLLDVKEEVVQNLKKERCR